MLTCIVLYTCELFPRSHFFFVYYINNIFASNLYASLLPLQFFLSLWPVQLVGSDFRSDFLSVVPTQYTNLLEIERKNVEIYRCTEIVLIMQMWVTNSLLYLMSLFFSHLTSLISYSNAIHLIPIECIVFFSLLIVLPFFASVDLYLTWYVFQRKQLSSTNIYPMLITHSLASMSLFFLFFSFCYFQRLSSSTSPFQLVHFSMRPPCV